MVGLQEAKWVNDKRSRKTENLNAKNVIYYCVDDPTPPVKGVRGKGRVKIYEDITHNIPIH